jgi:hypothetical protein
VDDSHQEAPVLVPQNGLEAPRRPILSVYDKDWNLLFRGDNLDDMFGLRVVVNSPEYGHLDGVVESVRWINRNDA